MKSSAASGSDGVTMSDEQQQSAPEPAASGSDGVTRCGRPPRKTLSGARPWARQSGASRS
jgi:hypothetical protein